ncbi:MAG: DEAD/DEAH box helicase [Kiritimatiellae bacterium]|nr:DEAD/DEAH box helicase [Kiritimatiellia bacterium]
MYQTHKRRTHRRYSPGSRRNRPRAGAIGPCASGRDPAPAPESPPRGGYPVAGVFASLLPELQRAVSERGYGAPTPIQSQSIPHLLARRDLYGCAQTGTGKTAAFALPILQRLVRDAAPRQPGRPQALILAPTRELAGQIGEHINGYARYTGLTLTVIFGGVGQEPQVRALRRGVNLVVATPGRLLDLMQQRVLALDAVRIFVLDEGDRMLDMGFLPDIRRIVRALPAQRQSLLFSATLPDAIVELAGQIVNDPVRVSVAPEQPAVERIDQKVLFVDKRDKVRLLTGLLQDRSKRKVIVFAQMKHAASKLAQKLESAGIRAVAIHGNKSQSARTQALARFKSGGARVLVATDIASRGIDVAGISHVINYDLPLEAETYVHRIGRTARAGAAGDAVSFCSAEERDLLRDIERLLRMPVPAVLDHALHSETARRATGAAARPAPRAGRRPCAARRTRQRTRRRR